MTPDDYRDRLESLHYEYCGLNQALNAVGNIMDGYLFDSPYQLGLREAHGEITEWIYQNLEYQRVCRCEIKRLERFMS